MYVVNCPHWEYLVRLIFVGLCDYENISTMKTFQFAASHVQSWDHLFYCLFLGEHVVEAKFSEFSEPEEEELVPHLEEEPMLTRLEVNANLELAEPEANSKSDDEYSTASEGDNVRAYEEEGGEGHMVSISSSLYAQCLDIPLIVWNSCLSCLTGFPV